MNYHDLATHLVLEANKDVDAPEPVDAGIWSTIEVVASKLRDWTDPTPLTLDVLRQELGEPDWENDGRARWFGKSRGMDLLWIGDALEFTQVAFLKAKTLGMYHRILSVIREQEG